VNSFVKRKTTRIVGTITILMLAVIIGIVTAVASTNVPTAQAVHSPLSVAVMVSNGPDPNKVIATMRAVSACGFSVNGIAGSDITQGRLTVANFDVLVLPGGCTDINKWYVDTAYGFTVANKTSVQTFASNGGGVVGLESGAFFMGTGATNLRLYNDAGTRVGYGHGKNNITYTDSAYGTGTQELYQTDGVGYFGLAAASGAYWAGSQVATATEDGLTGQNVIVEARYGTTTGLGHVVLCTLDPELRGDSIQAGPSGTTGRWTSSRTTRSVAGACSVR